MESTVWLESPIDEERAEEFAKECNVDPILAELMLQRDINSAIEAKKFLDPSLAHICNPFKLKDMERAVQRIERAISTGERMCIYGDYDVDGVTSTSLLVRGLSNLGANIEYFIPSRDDGYGLNKNALKELAEKYSLIITVDCGISALEEISYAAELGLDVIVTDHHEIQQIPPAYAVINPKREENSYHFRGLAGVGTAFMLLYALYTVSTEVKEEIFSLLDLVSIGTISDVVPLVSENRIFVKHGLKKINETENVGLKVIKERLFQGKEIKAIDIGFRIAPLLNAAGRLDEAKSVVEFLTTNDRERAEEIFNDLSQLNKLRQDIGKTMLTEVELMLEESQGVIVCADRGFHHGLVGIIAARLADKYNVPSIVIKIKEDGKGTGSARSVDGFNLVEAFKECEDLLVKFGGHARAAGLTILEENIPAFTARINEVYKSRSMDIRRKINIAKRIHDFNISLEFCSLVDRLKPFGHGNPEPIFVLEDVKVDSVRRIGKDESHLMFDVVGRNRIRNAVWFKHGSSAEKISPTESYDIAFRIEDNFFNGRVSPKLYIEDIKLSSRSKCSIKYYRDMYETRFPIESFILSPHPLAEGVEIIDKNSLFIFNGQRIPLNPELDLLLRELKRNYFFDFKLSTLHSTERENLFSTSVRIDRCFHLDDDANERELITKIKERLIGDFNYNDMQKKVLRSIIFEGESVHLLSKRGRGIKTIALAIAIYLFKKTGKKSIFLSDRRELPEAMKNFFMLSAQDREAPFKFVDNLDIKVDGLFLHFHEKDRGLQQQMKDEVRIPSNIIIVPKRSEGIVYNRGMKLEHKRAILERLKKGEAIKAERDILALL